MARTSVKNNKDKKDNHQLYNHIDFLEKIIALMPGHVYWLDKNNVYQGCNDLQAQAVQLDSRKDILGKTNYDLLWKDYAEQLNNINNEVMRSGQSHISEEAVVTANGMGIYLSQKVPLKNDDGEVIGLVGISFDITERKNTEQALKIAKEKAEIANQVKTEFMRNMEHDIRTPISGILGVASYLKLHQEKTQHQELLSDIEAASSELLDYLNNILEFSQITNDVIPIVSKEFSLQEMMNSILKMESPAVKHKQLKLKTKYSQNFPPTLAGDTFRIYRILLNLISNAIKFTNQGKIIIEVTVKSQQKNNIIIQLSISDTGIGIPKNQHKMIYEKFIRCLPANQGTYKGTGVGLWVVKQFIGELNGKIKLKSAVGKGSIFTITLPLQIPN